MKRFIHQSLLLALVSGTLSGCLFSGCSTEPSNKDAQDMGDMSPVGTQDMQPDLPSADCQESEDCSGPYEGFYCIESTCTECASGDLDCVCRANGTCKLGGRCDAGSNLCVTCEAGQQDCPCDEGEVCGEGLACEGEVCVEDTCVNGEDNCPCDTGLCTGGEESYCDEMSVCRICSSDVPGCPCDLDDTCLGDNYCFLEESECVECPEDNKPQGCVCQANSDCEVGLTCDEDNNQCRPKKECSVLCVPNQACDADGSGDPLCIPNTCVAGYEWQGSACVATTGETCDGRDGTADKSAECEAAGTACVEDSAGKAHCVLTCELISPSCIAENRDCDASTDVTQDALCGACNPGYVDDGLGTCIIDINASCSTMGDPDSIAGVCTGRNRVCTELAGGGAACGECLSGFELDADTDTCIEQLLCGGSYCLETQYCSYPQAGGPPRCEDIACGANEALSEPDASGNTTCVTCNLSCDGEGVYPTVVEGQCACASDVFCRYQTDGSATERCFVSKCGLSQALTPGGGCTECPTTCGDTDGERARQWPETTGDGSCFCETQEGYSIPFGGDGNPDKCDKDADGWINETSNATFVSAEANADVGVLANFRCDRREVDRFILQNEWRQQRAVSLCGDAFIDYDPDTAHGCTDIDGLVSLVLFESDKLDNDDLIMAPGNATAFPDYGNRKLMASELNSLTKGCVSSGNNFNDNEMLDILEEQAITTDGIAGVNFAGSNEKFAFATFSYFIELHDGYYEANTNSNLPGAYFIAERSRCEAGFSLGLPISGLYNQQCTRLRRGDYDYSTSQVGFDFAHWSCTDDADGTCGMFAPPTDASLDDLDGDNIADHGLCDFSDTMPNEPWRGMTHHSQFQCVQLTSDANPITNHKLPVEQVYKSGEANPAPYEFNICVAEDCSSGAPGCVTTMTQGVYQPNLPEITCETVERDDPRIGADLTGWVAVRYIPEGTTSSLAAPYYIRGCINEAVGTDGTDGWKNLCPGYDANPDAILAAGNPASGQLICSCDRFYGGSNCEYACKQRSYADPSNAVATSYVHVGDRDRGYSSEQLEDYACGRDDNFCSLHPPVTTPGMEFEGGRRGYWMCGDTSLTATYDTAGESVPYLNATNPNTGTTYQLEGKIQLMPVKRELLEQDATTCPNGGCYSVF